MDELEDERDDFSEDEEVIDHYNNPDNDEINDSINKSGIMLSNI